MTDTGVLLPRGEVVFAAHALLEAARLLDDLSADPEAQAAMPDDLRDRVDPAYYQESFERLPEDIQDEARALAKADPDIQTSRAHDGEARRG